MDSIQPFLMYDGLLQVIKELMPELCHHALLFNSGLKLSINQTNIFPELFLMLCSKNDRMPLVKCSFFIDPVLF